MDGTPHSGIEHRRVAQNVDGNAFTGLLNAFRGVDATLFVLTCGHCGQSAPLGQWPVELDATAAIVRCRGCTHTFATILRRPDGIEVRGSAGSITTPSDA